MPDRTPNEKRHTPNDRLPSRTLPLLYFGAAHIALALAAFLVAWSPRAVAGFFYHSWMVAIVHLVTLGWVTSSILGSIYIVAPATLGIPLPARRGDYLAFALVVTGIIGMVAHFWIEQFSGMAWSAATATSGILYVVARLVAGLRRAPVPGGVRVHVALAAATWCSRRPLESFSGSTRSITSFQVSCCRTSSRTRTSRRSAGRR